ncbi:MAG: hypothetical protein U0166_26920 [Acidobacteriota bacterium]
MAPFLVQTIPVESMRGAPSPPGRRSLPVTMPTAGSLANAAMAAVR